MTEEEVKDFILLMDLQFTIKAVFPWRSGGITYLSFSNWLKNKSIEDKIWYCMGLKSKLNNNLNEETFSLGPVDCIPTTFRRVLLEGCRRLNNLSIKN